MSIEDVTFRCNGCNAREVVAVVYDHQEQARLDGTIHTVVEQRTHHLHPLASPSSYFVPIPDQDRLRVKLPEGWDRRYGSHGKGYYHRCEKCVKQDVGFGP